MIEKIREIRRTLNTSIFVGERYEKNLKEASVIAVVFMMIGAVMATVNITHGEYYLSSFSFFCVISSIAAFVAVVKFKSRKIYIAIIIPSFVIAFTLLVYCSDNGFAYLWIMLTPVTICYLLSVKIGIYLTIYFQIFLIVLFYSPLRDRVASNFPEIVMSRFPILYFFNGAVSIFIMYSYHKSVLFEIAHAQEALELSEAKSNFLASMSHEIRTPINAILGMNEMILRENTDPEIGDYAESVKNSGQMLLMLVNDVLDFSKIEAGKMEIHETEFTLSMLLHNIMPMLRERAGEKCLLLKVTVSGQVPDGLVSDEFRIRQVMINLLNNAIKYTDKGSVELILKGEYTQDDKYNLVMSIKDTGRGISEEAQNHLFEAFSRADLKANRSIEGTGLGLAIVKRILDSMGGEISVNSKLGEGSEFIVMLPVRVYDKTPLQEDYEKQVKTVVADTDDNDYTAPDARILAVDDNAANLRIVSLFLKRVGIAPELCSSGTEAVRLCKEKHYDLLLLDHRMPDPDGIRTLEIIRNDDSSQNKDTPAVVLTANAIAGSDKIYSDAGFADYLTKPLDSSLLEKTVKKHLPADKILPVQDDVIVFRATTSDKKERTAPASLRKKLEGIEGLDYDAALKLAGGYEDLLAETVSIIVSECDDKTENMRRCIASEDWKGYGLVAHSIKGLMASVGLKELSDRARKHENAAEDLDAKFIRSDCEGFIEAYRDVCAKLK